MFLKIILWIMLVIPMLCLGFVLLVNLMDYALSMDKERKNKAAETEKKNQRGYHGRYRKN